MLVLSQLSYIFRKHVLKLCQKYTLNISCFYLILKNTNIN